MSKRETNLVKQIIGELLSQYGFSCHIVSPEGWDFTKVEGYLEQNISISRISGQYLRLYISNNAGYEKSLMDLIPADEYTGDKIFQGYFYHNEKEFVNALKIFAQVLQSYALDDLEKASHSPDTKVPKGRLDRDDFLFFKNNQKKLSEQYSLQWNINLDTKDREQMVEYFTKLENRINQEKNKDFIEIKEMLFGVSAVYGELLSRYFQSPWIKTGDNYFINGWILAFPFSVGFYLWMEKYQKSLVEKFYDFEEQMEKALKEQKKKEMLTSTIKIKDVFWTDEEEKYLLDHHEEVTEKYQVDWDIVLPSSQASMLDIQFIDQMNQKIEENVEKNFQDVKEILLGLGAIYGSIIEKQFQGKWGLNHKKKCELKTPIDIHPIPLDFMLSLWYHRDQECLKEQYCSLLESMAIYRDSL
ncbi:hypothetical protein FACS189418_5630 [Clostridia bacterium]|nr:hypothetical protein FACS189418_5630 [Clostridia bacterium]